MSEVIRYGADFEAQVGYTEYRKRPMDMTGYTATGDYDEFPYAGVVEECQEVAGAALAGALPTMQVETTLRRIEGDLAELTVRRTYYKKTAQESGGTGTGSGSGSGQMIASAGSWGTSKAHPTYETHAAPTQESVLTHPLIVDRSMDDTSKYCLKYVADGGGADDVMNLPNQVQGTPRDWLMAHGYAELLDLVLSAPNFLDPGLELTVSWEVSPDAPSEAFPELCTIQVPEGPVRARAPRNWLLIDATYRTQGGKTECVKKYKLSGPNGWDPRLYGES